MMRVWALWDIVGEDLTDDEGVMGAHLHYSKERPGAPCSQTIFGHRLLQLSQGLTG